MKVILVNGSPHENGCTYRALKEAEKALNEEGIETEIFQVGKAPVSGCTACKFCKKAGRCVIDDKVNVFTEKAKDADGFIFGSPVHYASAGGTLVSFMDRAFYSGGDAMKYKPAAAAVSCRRAGASTTFDVLNKYFTINCMPVVSSNYWNEVHGSCADDVEKDEEGLQTMRVLGYNMAWLIKCIAAGKAQGVTPKKENKVFTNFVR